MLIRRRALAAAPLALLAGCATRFATEDAAGLPRLQVQNPGLQPPRDALTIGAETLAPGDILLSSANAMTSLGIRLATLSPVSHAALYIGNGHVAEAVGEGIRQRPMPAFLEEEATVVAFRHPGVQADHVEKMRAFVPKTLGEKYNYVGVLLQAPFSIERRLCELPLTPSLLREVCLQGMGAMQVGLGRTDRFFCSQFVLEAYRRAGLPLTQADPRLVSPADLLHMREGDVPSLRSEQVLQVVGYLKLAPAPEPDLRAPA
ncbi:distant relative of cell wall-associated hydrolase [Ramlibacter sp. USB13]|uniref:Distant relative of cell wall-associated hydrolase n=1 Tax=Ramlibacter cellulosilyticus TaxID=2764187 RepID=A0A923MU64_9BURK|nr:YiiX/YebB-like N1pC/P60 family cysteine hydrolase [Ramlibacter cellulosilyticus]MBC5785318.1 distant relative of cell wall-associated hydrolase [Ramlibacter cellulosilyticus]